MHCNIRFSSWVFGSWEDDGIWIEDFSSHDVTSGSRMRYRSQVTRIHSVASEVSLIWVISPSYYFSSLILTPLHSINGSKGELLWFQDTLYCSDDRSSENRSTTRTLKLKPLPRRDLLALQLVLKILQHRPAPKNRLTRVQQRRLHLRKRLRTSKQGCSVSYLNQQFNYIQRLWRLRWHGCNWHYFVRHPSSVIDLYLWRQSIWRRSREQVNQVKPAQPKLKRRSLSKRVN